MNDGAPQEMSLVLACDAGYAMPLATTLRSIVDSNPQSWPLDIHVLVDDFPLEARRKVTTSLPAESAEINWISVDLRAFEEFSTLPGISKMTYARFLIPRALPDRVSRVLYLDTDILILDDLRRIWAEDLGNSVVGAVRDGLDAQIKAGAERVSRVPRVRDYFNAGVLLIDLVRWRSERISELSLEYLRRFPTSPFSDQDALNVACDGRWKRLKSRWNYQAHLKVSIADMAEDDLPSIIHFITNLKPWKPSSVNPNSALYDEFRSRTQFRRTTVEKIREFFLWHLTRLHQLLSRSERWRAFWGHLKRWTRLVRHRLNWLFLKFTDEGPR